MTNHSADISWAIAKAVSDQSWVARRKDTIVTIFTGLGWLAGALAPYVTSLPVEVGVALGVVATFAGAMVTALTKGAFTPSMADRLNEVVENSLPTFNFPAVPDIEVKPIGHEVVIEDE